MVDELAASDTVSVLPEEWFEGEFSMELPHTPSRPRPLVHGPVCYEAVLRPRGDEWIAEDHSAGCHVVAPTQEAAKQALAEALGDRVNERAGRGMPIPKPAYVEEGWIVFTVSPAFRERLPELDQGEPVPPTPAVEGDPEDPPRRTVTLGPYRNADGSVTYTTVTLGPLLSRMTGPGRTIAGAVTE